MYHCNKEAAFGLFVMIIEDYELEEVYLKGVPGLYTLSTMIDKLLPQKKSLMEIYAKLKENDIKIEMFATDWMFTLFSNVIPIEIMV